MIGRKYGISGIFVALAVMMVVTGLPFSFPNAHASPTIRFVGSRSESSITNSSGTHTTSITLSYTSVTGHFIFVAVNILFGCVVSSVTDSGGSTYSKLARYGSGGSNGMTTGNGTGNAVEAWSTTGRGSVASTSFTVNYFENSPGTPCTGFIPGVSVAEYSGANDKLGAVAVNGNTEGNSIPTLSFTLTHANNWLISGFNVVDGNAVLTANAGNLRTTNSAPTGMGAIVDNTASKGSVTTSLSISGGSPSNFWVVVGVELRVQDARS